jgi:hypothetical protein
MWSPRSTSFLGEAILPITTPWRAFPAVLFPGQVQVISVPYALGEQQQVLRVRRIDDRIEIARVPGSSNF